MPPPPGEQTGPRARFATGEFGRVPLSGAAGNAGPSVRPVSPAEDAAGRPGTRRGGRHSGEFSQVQPREGGRHSGEFTEVQPGGRHSGAASVPVPEEPTGRSQPVGRHSGEFKQVQARASVAVPGDVSAAVPRHGTPEPTGRASVSIPGDVSQALPGRATPGEPAQGRATPGEVTTPARATVTPPGEVSQAVPGRASVAVPGEVSQAVPGRASAAVPGEVSQAMPGRASVAVPSDVSQAVPGRPSAGEREEQSRAFGVPQEEPAPDEAETNPILAKLRSQRRLRVGVLIAASVVALILLPALVAVRSMSSDPVYASLDSLNLPAWAATKVDDRSSGSRWCLEECKFRERTAQSQQPTDATTKAYTSALSSAGWQPWKVESCPDQPITDGKYSCWRRDEFTLDLWVRQPECAVDAVAAQDPAALPSLGPDGVVPTGPPKDCTGSTVSIKVQAAIADQRGKPQPKVDPSLVGETPDPVVPSDPLLEPSPTQS